MKNILAIIALLFIVANWNTCFSQTDSILVETEISQEDQQYYENKYMYLDVNLSDVDKMLKLGIQPFKPNDLYDFTVFTIHMGLEQKLNSSFTYTNELNDIILLSENEAFHQLGYSIGTRYYFTKRQEIAKGKSGDNCNGVYMLLKISDLLNFKVIKTESFEDEGNYSRPYLNRYIDFSLKPEIGLGIQQSIKHHLYFDANITFNYDILYKEPGFGITFLFGGFLSFMK